MLGVVFFVSILMIVCAVSPVNAASFDCEIWDLSLISFRDISIKSFLSSNNLLLIQKKFNE